MDKAEVAALQEYEDEVRAYRCTPARSRNPRGPRPTSAGACPFKA